MDQKKIVILEKIGIFFLHYHEDDYAKTKEFLHNAAITKVEILSATEILIWSRRPGFLIGRRGTTIDGLSSHLNMDIRIIEDTEPSLYDYLIPAKLSFYDDCNCIIEDVQYFHLE